MSIFSSIGNAFKNVIGAVAPVAIGAATGGAGVPVWQAVAGNVAGNLINSAVSGHYARENMEKQVKLQKELFAYENLNKHQFEVQDLKAAGLNPILSAFNGSSVGVGGVGLSNPISQENPFSSAMQMNLAKRETEISQQNANTNSMLAGSTVDRNYKEGLLAEANANSAVKLLPLLEKQKNAEIINSTKVAESEAAKNYAIGGAAQVQASAAAAKSYQDILESRERSLGYAGERRGQEFRNLGIDLDNALKRHYYNVRMGNNSAKSFADFYNIYWHGK